MIRQYGVLAYRHDPLAELRILLITSRDTRRWIVPRGNHIRGLSPAASAAQEAYEEAGILGALHPVEIGRYDYRKRRGNGSEVAALVHLFALEVVEERSEWPEGHQRDRRWFAPEEAAEAVSEPALADLIRAFRPPVEAQNPALSWRPMR